MKPALGVAAPHALMDHATLAALARPALITAAMRRTPLAYKELGQAIGYPGDVPLSHHMNRILDLVSSRCIGAGEPSLAVLAREPADRQAGRGLHDRGEGAVRRGPGLLPPLASRAKGDGSGL